MEIDRMREEDLDEVMKMGFACEGFDTGTSADQFYSKETLQRWIYDSNGVTLVSRDEGKLTGFILGSFMTGPRGSYIHTIEVKEQYRGGGTGSKLVAEAINQFRKKGAVHLFCVVKDKNQPALELFKKEGLEIGEQFRYVEMMID
jgi:ribosomal protein S18 acetylase RimI-like enzyme